MKKFYVGEFDEFGNPSGYLNANGDTVIPIGKYFYCYTDTITTFGKVIDYKTGKFLEIDNNGNELFEIFPFDNGPDYLQNGLFRIIQNGKIGYADSIGRVVLKPTYNCAYPFEKGKAKVSGNCSSVPGDNHSVWISKSWYYIDKKGIRIIQK